MPHNKKQMNKKLMTLLKAKLLKGDNGADALFLLNQVRELAEKVEEESATKEDVSNLEKVLEEFSAQLNKLASRKPPKGEKGDKGDKGEKGDKGKDGKDGKTPVAGIDYFTIEEQIKFAEDVVTDVVNILEKLEDDEKIDASAIKNLEENIDLSKLDLPDLEKFAKKLEKEIKIDAKQVKNLPKPTQKVINQGGSDKTLKILSGGSSISQDATRINFTGNATLSKQGNGVKVNIPDNPSVGVYRHLWFDAAAFTPRETNGATPDTTEFTTNDINIDSLLFDGATEEGAQIKFSLPEEWDAGAIKVKVYWDAATGASAGDKVVWGISAFGVSDDGAEDAPFGTEDEILDTVAGVGDLHISPVSKSITIDNVNDSDDLIILQVTRKVDNVNDDMTEDAKFLGIKLQYKESTTEPTQW